MSAMPFIEVQDLPAAGRLLALDVGDKTVGVAVCDPGRMVASPAGTVRRARRFADTAAMLLAAADERGTAALVVGLPLDLDGGEGRRARQVRQFVVNLLQHRDLPALMWDERFSTNAVERAMLADDASRRRRRAAKDTLAAVYILQGFLDSLPR